jgi:hypothetical protein
VANAVTSPTGQLAVLANGVIGTAMASRLSRPTLPPSASAGRCR